LIRTHFGQHPDGCFGCHLISVQFGNVEAPVERSIEQRIEKDLPAYKRMRDNGLQPPSTRNAYELEQRANTEFEVKMGKLVSPEVWRKGGSQVMDTLHVVDEGQRRAKAENHSIDELRSWAKKKYEKGRPNRMPA